MVLYIIILCTSSINIILQSYVSYLLHKTHKNANNSLSINVVIVEFSLNLVDYVIYGFLGEDESCGICHDGVTNLITIYFINISVLSVENLAQIYLNDIHYKLFGRHSSKFCFVIWCFCIFPFSTLLFLRYDCNGFDEVRLEEITKNIYSIIILFFAALNFALLLATFSHYIYIKNKLSIDEDFADDLHHRRIADYITIPFLFIVTFYLFQLLPNLLNDLVFHFKYFTKWWVILRNSNFIVIGARYIHLYRKELVREQTKQCVKNALSEINAQKLTI